MHVQYMAGYCSTAVSIVHVVERACAAKHPRSVYAPPTIAGCTYYTQVASDTSGPESKFAM